MILAKLGRNAEANDSFSRAVQVEMRLPKAWAAWGYYNDRKFKEEPGDTTLAANALSCYLQAVVLLYIIMPNQESYLSVFCGFYLLRTLRATYHECLKYIIARVWTR
ncbi:unnamed protein product [Rhizophagus irregularis]|uniref:PIK-related kinase FAT domain-containing protein n=1 Tax=Rhizophagus irregularis TaxID=588596 RepID=A0A916E5V2_9GLOM|nr:unnamed protein product [Rhizophagus irregularis]CAB5364697.1 unnamed protein product [Rhizophagus irregularis]